MNTLGKTLLSIPYQWSGVDATHWLWNKHTPHEVNELWEQALLEAVENSEQFVFIWHSHVMGLNPEWLATGERIIRFIQQNKQLQIVSLSTIREYAVKSSIATVPPPA